MAPSFRFAFVALSVLELPVLAAPVYKCKDEKGNVVFTDKKCDADAKPQRVWDNHLGDVAYPATFSGATPDEVRAGLRARQSNADPGNATNSDDNAVAGFLCETGQSQWVQDSPCPSVVDENRTTTFQHRDGTQSSMTTDSPTHVHQTRLSHDGLCNNLSAAANSYERNRLAKAHDCH